MKDHLSPGSEIPRARVSVEIPCEQECLEGHETGIPHCGGPAKQWQHEPRKERLDPEQQECAGECSYCEDCRQLGYSGWLRAKLTASGTALRISDSSLNTGARKG